MTKITNKLSVELKSYQSHFKITIITVYNNESSEYFKI